MNHGTLYPYMQAHDPKSSTGGANGVMSTLKTTQSGSEGILQQRATLTVPPEALSEEAGYAAIKGTWLVQNFESEILDAWKQTGGFDPIPFHYVGGEDWGKPLVWIGEVDGEKRVVFNQLGQELIAQLFGGYIESIEMDEDYNFLDSPTKLQFDALKRAGKSNQEIIMQLGLSLGGRYTSDGSFCHGDAAFVRSGSRVGDAQFRSWGVDGGGSRILRSWGGFDAGLVPRVFLNKTQSQ